MNPTEFFALVAAKSKANSDADGFEAAIARAEQAGAPKSGFAAPAREHPMVKELLAAGQRFDTMMATNNFANGKGDTCRDIAGRLKRAGSFASEKQEGFARKLVEWSLPRAQDQRPPSNPHGAERFTVRKLFAVLQKHADFIVDTGEGEFKVSRKNQDTLCWLIWRNVCVGKLEGTGEVTLFSGRLKGDAARVEALLRELDANPLQAAMKYGRLSGRCCSCGRDLTDPDSIEAGIGPVCARKFS